MSEKIIKFKKEQLYHSKRYLYQKDLIMSLLEEDKEYTLEQVDKIIQKFNNKEVK